MILTTGTEGQEITVTEGATYTWSDNLSLWIRKEAYDLSDSNIAVHASIEGDVVPSSETPAWNETTGNGGVWAASGGWAEARTSGGTFMTAYANAPPITAGITAFGVDLQITSHSSCIGSPGNQAHRIAWSDKTKVIIFNLHHHVSGALRPVDLSNDVVGTVGSGPSLPDLTSTSAHLFVVADPAGDVSYYVDHAADPSWTVPYSSLVADAGGGCYIGDLDNTANEGQQIIRFQNLYWYKLT